jgi:hypothetical protein
MAFAGSIVVGEKMPHVVIEDKGEMIIDYTIVDGTMTYKSGSEIAYKMFNSNELQGKIRTIYHLAARSGIDAINQPFIDALIAAKLPETLPDSPYKTLTILNTDDALWGTASIANGQLADSQKETAYANYVVDKKGLAANAWGLQKKSSAIIVVGSDNQVLYFRDGKMSADEIATAVALIKSALSM